MPFGRIDIVQTAYLLVGLMIALTIHEFSHALVAYRLGDRTAKVQGRLTLNPIAHLDPLGTIMMVWMAIGGFGLGWAKPVPVNPFNIRGMDPRAAMALVSLAGPTSNLILATLVALLLRGAIETGTLTIVWPFELGFRIVQVNVIIAIFNLIPIPPLDGFGVLLGILPHTLAAQLAPLERYGPFILLFVLFFGFGIVRTILSTFATPILNALLG